MGTKTTGKKPLLYFIFTSKPLKRITGSSCFYAGTSISFTVIYGNPVCDVLTLCLSTELEVVTVEQRWGRGYTMLIRFIPFVY